MNKNFDVKIVLEEVKAGYQRQEESMDVFKKHARTLFSASSIILTLLGVMQIFSLPAEVFKGLYGGIIAGILILYILLVGISLIVNFPIQFLGPIELNWDVLSHGFMEKKERDVILMQISCYLNVIDLNRKSIKTRYKLILTQNIIFGLIVLLVITAGLIPHL
jgi:hypothetical protein